MKTLLITLAVLSAPASSWAMQCSTFLDIDSDDIAAYAVDSCITRGQLETTPCYQTRNQLDIPAYLGEGVGPLHYFSQAESQYTYKIVGYQPGANGQPNRTVALMQHVPSFISLAQALEDFYNNRKLPAAYTCQWK